MITHEKAQMEAYFRYFGMSEEPFGVTPDPRYLYFSETHREALASLVYSIESRRGFSGLIARPGMGKTSLLFRVLESLQDRARTAFVFQTDCNSREFFRSLMTDLSIRTPDSLDMAQTYNALNQMLLTERSAGRRVVLVIDEAQNLENQVLESVRLLSNFETTSEKLLHIVLAGQPELEKKLAQPELLQLRQRVSPLVALQPLSHAECAAYVQHRLKVAGYSAAPLFAQQALDMAIAASEGTPRELNNICFHALSLAFAVQRRIIDEPIMEETLRDLKFTPRKISSAQPQIPPPQISPPQIPQARQYVLPDYNYVPPRRQSHFARNAFLTVVLFAIAGLFLYSRLQGTTVDQLANDTVGAVLSENAPDADGLALPAALRPPAPPVIERAPIVAADDANESATGGADQAQASPAESATTRASNANSETPRPRSAGPRSVVTGPPQKAEQMSVVYRRSSQVIRITKPQTLFELALEQYGKSSWEIVRQIRELNPSLKGPYDIVPRGAEIRLPPMVSVDGSDTSGRR